MGKMKDLQMLFEDIYELITEANEYKKMVEEVKESLKASGLDELYKKWVDENGK